MSIQNIHDAIYNLYPNAIGVTGNTIDEVTAIGENGNQIALDKNAITAEIVNVEAAEETKKQSIQVAKASALSKLTALGLTADEVKALLGTS